MKKLLLTFITLIATCCITNAQWTADTISSAKMYLAGAGAGNKVVFAGGIGTGNPSIIYDLFNSSTGQFSTGNLSAARKNLTGASTGNWIVFAGGYNDITLQYSNKIDKYNAATNVWTSSSPLSVARGFMAGAAAGSKIAFAGGEANAVAFTNVDILDTLTNAWSTGQLSQARTHLAGAGAGTKLLFAGGGDPFANIVYNIVDIYDYQAQTWTTDTLSIGRSNMAAVLHGNKIYFAGGITANVALSNRIDIYDVLTDTWTIDSLSQARQYASAGTSGDLVIFAGGCDISTSTPFNTVDIYNTVTGTWTISAMTTPRFLSAAASAGNLFAIAGGVTTGFTPTNSVEFYSVSSVGLTHTTLDNSIQTMPNPTNGKVSILFAKAGEISSYNLYDMCGKRIMNGTIPASSSTFELNLEGLLTGVYTLQLVHADGITNCKKIIKN